MNLFHTMLRAGSKSTRMMRLAKMNLPSLMRNTTRAMSKPWSMSAKGSLQRSMSKLVLQVDLGKAAKKLLSFYFPIELFLVFLRVLPRASQFSRDPYNGLLEINEKTFDRYNTHLLSFFSRLYNKSQKKEFKALFPIFIHNSHDIDLIEMST